MYQGGQLFRIMDMLELWNYENVSSFLDFHLQAIARKVKPLSVTLIIS